jgi:hypothetical protein
MRNFGVVSRSSGLGATESSLKPKRCDGVILAVAGAGLIGLSLAIYALAFGFGAEHEVTGILPFLP